MGQRDFARIRGIVAAEANFAAVFRRRPSRYTQLLKWDLETDEVVICDLFHGRVYTERCDISPNGEYLVLHTANYAWKGYCSTTITKFPSFTPIAQWFTGSTQNGGGVWDSNTMLGLDCAATWDAKVNPPEGILTYDLGLPNSDDEPILLAKFIKHGWTEVAQYNADVTNRSEVDAARDRMKFLRQRMRQFEIVNEEYRTLNHEYFRLLELKPQYANLRDGILEKQSPYGTLRRVTGVHNGCLVRFWQFVATTKEITQLTYPQSFTNFWIDFDGNGRVVYANWGCLWRLDHENGSKPMVVADLNNNPIGMPGESVQPDCLDASDQRRSRRFKRAKEKAQARVIGDLG